MGEGREREGERGEVGTCSTFNIFENCHVRERRRRNWISRTSPWAVTRQLNTLLSHSHFGIHNTTKRLAVTQSPWAVTIQLNTLQSHSHREGLGAHWDISVCTEDFSRCQFELNFTKRQGTSKC